ncbi:hypothetical protein MD484_g8894, partial [Candolleomyces efflorescens]
MKFSSAFLLASFTLLASAAPSTDPTTAEQGIKEKIAAITDREGSLVESNARAPVTATVSGDGVRYRRCPKTSCEAVGEYNKGQIITIRCLAFGESINGWKYVYFQLVFLPIELQTDDFSFHLSIH